MLKNKVVTLAKNLKNNKDAREQSLRLITELAGVATSVSNGNHSFKLQRLISKTTLGFSTAIALRTLIELVLEHSKDKTFVIPAFTYNVRIFSSEVLYNEIKSLLATHYTTQTKVNVDREPEIVIKSLDVSDFYCDETDMDATKVEEIPKKYQILVEGEEGNRGVYTYVQPITKTETQIDIEGFKIEVEWVERRPAPPKEKKGETLDYFDAELVVESRGSRPGRDSAERMKETHDSYVFHCKTPAERKAVQEFLRKMGPKAHGVDRDKSTSRGSADIFVAEASGGGSWSSIPARTSDTVILPEGLMDEMVKEIKTFLQHENLYYMLGVPYHHGIMLSGAPGTGKSSAAQAIASELRMQTYSASLSTLESNDAFIKFIKNVNSNSVVLLEDIDVAQGIVSNRDAADGSLNAKNGVTMETLLNVLDGVLSPHGCVFILTTNHLDKIDPAVVRPGRVDATYDITYLTDEQFERLCRKFMQLKPEVELNLPSVEGLNITPASIVGVVKRFIPTIADALPHVIDFVNEERAKLLVSV
jgi:hypothetical protein